MYLCEVFLKLAIENVDWECFFSSKEVKAGENSIDVVREPVATCSAISCGVTITVSSEYKVNEQWVIFKNHTAMVSFNPTNYMESYLCYHSKYS